MPSLFALPFRTPFHRSVSSAHSGLRSLLLRTTHPTQRLYDTPFSCKRYGRRQARPIFPPRESSVPRKPRTPLSRLEHLAPAPQLKSSLAYLVLSIAKAFPPKISKPFLRDRRAQPLSYAGLDVPLSINPRSFSRLKDSPPACLFSSPFATFFPEALREIHPLIISFWHMPGLRRVYQQSVPPFFFFFFLFEPAPYSLHSAENTRLRFTPERSRRRCPKSFILLQWRGL